MVEVMEGSGVYWYPHQRAYCSAFKCWPGYINAAIDIFFSKETLAVSCARGNEKKQKDGSSNQPLSPLIIEALIGKLSHHILVSTWLYHLGFKNSLIIHKHTIHQKELRVKCWLICVFTQSFLISYNS